VTLFKRRLRPQPRVLAASSRKADGNSRQGADPIANTHVLASYKTVPGTGAVPVALCAPRPGARCEFLIEALLSIRSFRFATCSFVPLRGRAASGKMALSIFEPLPKQTNYEFSRSI
jgi:hypothetical protein